MVRPKKESTKKIERLQEKVADQTELLRKKLREDNPVFEEIEKLTKAKGFVLHHVKINTSSERFFFMSKMIRNLHIDTLEKMNREEAKEWIYLFNEFFDDVDVLRKLYDDLRS